MSDEVGPGCAIIVGLFFLLVLAIKLGTMPWS